MIKVSKASRIVTNDWLAEAREVADSVFWQTKTVKAQQL